MSPMEVNGANVASENYSQWRKSGAGYPWRKSREITGANVGLDLHGANAATKIYGANLVLEIYSANLVPRGLWRKCRFRIL